MPPTSRTAFNRSPLIRTLARLDASLDGLPGTETAQTPTAPSLAAQSLAEQTLAETLGQWLHWTDAISLHGVLNGDPAKDPQLGAPALSPARAPARAPATASALAAELRQLRQQLTLSITDDAALATELAEHAGATQPAEQAWAPCRRRHVALQQAMAARSAPLRASLRASLQARSPALARLAAIDAVLESALAEREHHLLAKLPRLLEQHFSRLNQAQARAQAKTTTPAQARTQAPQPAAPATPATAAAAPGVPRPQAAALRQTLQQLLLDELALRLQPLEGLLLALQNPPASAT